MYHYKARIYSPTLGRFFQTDPIGYDDQINLYTYVGGDPINRTDPSGLEQTWGDYFQQHLIEPIGRIPGDIADAAEHLAEGDVGYVADGLPPMTGAGAGTKAGISIVGKLTGLFKGETAAAKAATGAAKQAAGVAKEGGASRGAVSGLVTKAKEVFTGASTRAGGPGGPTNSVVRQAVDGVPQSQRSLFHGCCGEVDAASRALNAGADIAGATVRTVSVRSGQIIEACSSCKAVLDVLGVKY